MQKNTSGTLNACGRKPLKADMPINGCNAIEATTVRGRINPFNFRRATQNSPIKDKPQKKDSHQKNIAGLRKKA